MPIESVPLDHKYAIKDDVLPDGTCVKKGWIVNYNPYYQGRSERIWGKDALIFCPERWLHPASPDSCLDGQEEKIQFKDVSPFQYPTFNAGPRTCIGKPLALMTTKLVLARLLPLFKFIDNEKHSGEYAWALCMKMKGGFPVTIRKR